MTASHDRCIHHHRLSTPRRIRSGGIDQKFETRPPLLGECRVRGRARRKTSASARAMTYIKQHATFSSTDVCRLLFSMGVASIQRLRHFLSSPSFSPRLHIRALAWKVGGGLCLPGNRFEDAGTPSRNKGSRTLSEDFFFLFYFKASPASIFPSRMEKTFAVFASRQYREKYIRR